MFDTHAHLQFEAFHGKVDEVVALAREAGVTHLMLPSTDVTSSRRAIEIAQNNEDVYAGVGIHPHHVFKHQTESKQSDLNADLAQIESLIKSDKVLAVGEIGLDRHYYKQTKYTEYEITEGFISLQKDVMKQHIKWALKYDKCLILHNRLAHVEFLEVLIELWDIKLEGRTVFHCCEPRREFLDFARQNKVFIGIDGDVTYAPEKQSWVKEIPDDLLVLETDSPFLIPEPQRSLPRESRGWNTPANLPVIAKYIAKLCSTSFEEIATRTHDNAMRLFGLA